MTDAAAVGRAVRGVDCIFHDAALASVPRSVEHPLDTQRGLRDRHAERARPARRGRRAALVYAASSSAYGDQPTSSKRESRTCPPRSRPMARPSWRPNITARPSPPRTVSRPWRIRYFNVFGPRQDPNSQYSAVIPLFITALLAGRRPTIYGDGRQSRDFTYVANVVHGNLLAADAPHVAGRVFNVANGRSTSLLQLIAAAQRVRSARKSTQPSRAGATGRRSRKPGRYHPSPPSAWLRAADLFRRRPARDGGVLSRDR